MRMAVRETKARNHFQDEMGMTQMSEIFDRMPGRHKPKRAPRAQASVPIATPGEQPPEQITGFMDNAHRHAMIAQHAYYLAEQRGFEPGYELDDWLIAERDIEQSPESHGSESRTLCGD